MSRILIVSLLGWLVSFAAVADTPHNEIIYRVNLGRSDDVALLLKQGASPDDKNAFGVPLLALAASRRDGEGLEVIKVLLKAGAHVDAKDADGQTALFYAVRQGNQSIVKYLLSKGADYYATDNSGTTARNLAYTSGQQDIGTAIDDFVKAQGAERAEQYKKFNEAVADRLKPQPTPPPQPQPAPTAESPPPAKTEAAPAQPKPSAEPPPVVPTPEEKAAQAAAQEQRQKESNKLMSDMAFNNCAFQYWSYVSDSGQSTDLSPDALDDTIDSYKDKVVALDEQLSKEYDVKRWIITNVSNWAKQRIFNELNAMPSKSYRHEQGVGKDDDMQSRCHVVARHWDKKPEAPPPPPKRGGR